MASCDEFATFFADKIHAMWMDLDSGLDEHPDEDGDFGGYQKLGGFKA